MTQSPSTRSGRQILPTNKVVTVIATEEAVNEAVADLIAFGFEEEAIFIHHGEQGQSYIDPDGTRGGLLSSMVRRYQRLQGNEKRMLDDAEAGLEEGQYLIGVQTDGSEEQQIAARDALAPYTQKSIYFCGRFTIMILVYNG